MRITQQYYWTKQLENAQEQIRLARKRVDLAVWAIILILLSMGLQILLFFLR